MIRMESPKMPMEIQEGLARITDVTSTHKIERDYIIQQQDHEEKRCIFISINCITWQVRQRRRLARSVSFWFCLHLSHLFAIRTYVFAKESALCSRPRTPIHE